MTVFIMEYRKIGYHRPRLVRLRVLLQGAAVMIVKIGFDPANLKVEDEAWPAFNAGGLTLKVWALYKKHFVTSQHFRESLVQMAEIFERMLDIEDHDVRPYLNIDEFMGYLGACGIYGTVVGPRHKEMAEWVVRHWDYFNLSTQRAVTLQFKVVKEVDETLTICGFGLTTTV